MQKCGNLKESHLWTMNYSQFMSAERGRISISKNELSNWLPNTKWSSLKQYAHRQQKESQKVVFIYLCIHTCVSVSKKKDYHFESRGVHVSRWTERSWEGLEEAKRRGKVI